MKFTPLNQYMYLEHKRLYSLKGLTELEEAEHKQLEEKIDKALTLSDFLEKQDIDNETAMTVLQQYKAQEKLEKHSKNVTRHKLIIGNLELNEAHQIKEYLEDSENELGLSIRDVIGIESYEAVANK